MKKINIGIVLMILSVTAFIAYRKIDIKIKEKEIEDTKEFVNEYITLVHKYTIFPEEYRDINKQMPEKEYNNFVTKMKEDLGKYILDTQQDELFEQYEEVLKSEYKGRLMYDEYNVNVSYSEPDNLDPVIRQSRVKEDMIIIYLDEIIKTTGDRREAPVIDAQTNRYIGKIKHVEGVWPKLGNIIILKKVANGEYKVVMYYKYANVNMFPFE